MDIESIMQEIRDEIKEKGYKENDLEFKVHSGPHAEKVDIDDVGIDIEKFRKKVLLLNCRKNVNPEKTLYTADAKKKLLITLKKVIRKLNRFYVHPIVQEQNEFNEVSVELLFQVYALLKENQELKERVDNLEKVVRNGEAKE